MQGRTTDDSVSSKLIRMAGAGAGAMDSGGNSSICSILSVGPSCRWTT